MKETIFKVGDRVFDVRFGWGEICNISCYYIDVKFDKKYETQTYSDYGARLLSFTEYTLQKFSQERPINYEDYVGKWGKFWDKKELFVVSKLAKFDKYSDCPFTIIAEEHFKHFEPLTEEQIKILGLE